MTDHESLHQNYGGDCMMCMAEFGDPDATRPVIKLQQAEKLLAAAPKPEDSKP